MTSYELAWKIRRHAIEMTHLSGGSHIASILSVADIISVLYNDVVLFDSQNPRLENRDRVILSKGHAGAAIYAALAEKGFFSTSILRTHYQNGSILSGHVSHKGVPGVEISTGSLGHGLSIGAGMAYEALLSQKTHSVYVVLGDGENDEGSIWEAALVANHFKLYNLIAIVDYNKMQSLDYVENTISLVSLSDKWKAFGWNVIEFDGHNHEAILNAFLWAKLNKNKPSMLIAHTVKGKGISFMENDILWHYRYPHDGFEYNTALEELRRSKPITINDPYEMGDE